MIFDLTVGLAFVATALKVVFPGLLLRIQNLDSRFGLLVPIFLICIYLLTLSYLVIFEPFSLTLILFSVVGLLTLAAVKRTSASLFFRGGLISFVFMAGLVILRLSFLAEASAILSLIFLVAGFLSLFYQQTYEF